jgi:actin, other eukaryote
MEKIWHHTFFKELKISPDECKFLVSESPGNEKKDREKIAQISFESFNFLSL